MRNIKKNTTKSFISLIGLIVFYLNNEKKHVHLSKTLTLLNKHGCQAKI
jgi:hypothetical protein